MKENLALTQGLVHSQRVMLALTQAAWARGRLSPSGRTRDAGLAGKGALLDLLEADKEVHACLMRRLSNRCSISTTPQTRRHDLRRVFGA